MHKCLCAQTDICECLCVRAYKLLCARSHSHSRYTQRTLHDVRLSLSFHLVRILIYIYVYVGIYIYIYAVQFLVRTNSVRTQAGTN